MTSTEATAAVGVAATLFLPMAMDTLFTDTLRLRGYPEFSRRATIHKRHCLHLLARRSAAQSVRLLDALLQAVTVPLNLVPIAGTIAYLALNGYLRGLAAHLLYLHLKGLSFAEAREFVRRRRLA
ncbi:hypothetical protein HK405_005719 [Cladochytrium tenue]|nr:hypothetical protein HK405_005719 [Cladochytrium tenue]